MTKAGKRLIQAANEALALARGEASAGVVDFGDKRFELRQKVVCNDGKRDEGVIARIELPGLSEDGPIFVKWSGHSQLESFFDDELIWRGDYWETL